MYTAALLDRQRFQVEVLSGPQTGTEGSLIEEVRARGIPLTILPSLVREIDVRRDLQALFQLYRFLQRRSFTIVHTHSSKAGILGRMAARIARVPIIVHTVHGWSFHDHMSPLLRVLFIALERATARLTDALVVVTRRDIDKGLKAQIGHPQQYHLIRSAIPLEEFDPSKTDRYRTRQALGIPTGVPVLGNVGRFSLQKNPVEWIRVAGRIARVLPRCWFLLVGDGPLRPEVEAALTEEGIASQTVLTGLRRDVPQMLAAMDVFLLTSLWEGLPRVIPQALAMKVPVVANRVDGTAEAIRDGETGFLCEPGDLRCLSDRCLTLLRDPLLRLKMGHLGREYVLKEFDLHYMVDQIADLYEGLLSEKCPL